MAEEARGDWCSSNTVAVITCALSQTRSKRRQQVVGVRSAQQVHDLL